MKARMVTERFQSINMQKGVKVWLHALHYTGYLCITQGRRKMINGRGATKIGVS